MRNINTKSDVSFDEKVQTVVREYAEACQRAGIMVSKNVFMRGSCSFPRFIDKGFSWAEVLQMSQEDYPKAFEALYDHPGSAKKMMERLRAKVKKFNTFVVTSIVTDSEINKKFLASIETYCEVNKGIPLFIAINPKQEDAANIRRMVGEKWAEHVILDDLTLNDHLFVCAIKMSKNAVNPIGGKMDLTNQGKSAIIGHPRLAMDVRGRSPDHKMSPVVMTTGAITDPLYSHRVFEKKAADYMGLKRHALAALVVEVKDRDVFYVRHIMARPDGSFQDLENVYSPKGKSKIRRGKVIAMVGGDIHSQQVDEEALGLAEKLAKEVGCKTFVAHDLVDGSSCNPHEKDDVIIQAQNFEKGYTLESELDQCVKVLDRLGNTFSEVVVARSNHDLFVSRYLSAGNFPKDPQNFFLASKLVEPAKNGENVIAHYVLPRVKKPKTFRFLGNREGFVLGGIQLAHHGHRGKNGMKATKATLSEDLGGDCVIGHLHHPFIVKGAWGVGCLCKIVLPYTASDPSTSWTHSVILLYENGERVHVIFVDGDFRLRRRRK